MNAGIQTPENDPISSDNIPENCWEFSAFLGYQFFRPPVRLQTSKAISIKIKRTVLSMSTHLEDTACFFGLSESKLSDMVEKNPSKSSNFVSFLKCIVQWMETPRIHNIIYIYMIPLRTHFFLGQMPTVFVGSFVQFKFCIAKRGCHLQPKRDIWSLTCVVSPKVVVGVEEAPKASWDDHGPMKTC